MQKTKKYEKNSDWLNEEKYVRYNFRIKSIFRKNERRIKKWLKEQMKRLL